MTTTIMTMSTSQVRAWVDIGESEQSVEGHWYAPADNTITLAPSAVVCPFCSRTMDQVKAKSLFGRIVLDEEQHRNGQTSVIVDLLPPTHDAFICSGCDVVLTRTKDQTWN
jgi:hypothetical protein